MQPKRDEHCMKSGIAIETMEQHLRCVLGQKFGLKELVADWEHAVREALERNQHQDVHVSVFKKVRIDTGRGEGRLLGHSGMPFVSP